MEVHGEIYWNWIVAVDLFGAGLSAGAFFLSAMAYFLGQEKYDKITRIGAYIAPFPLIIGIICLIIDLERPHLFWKLLLTVQPNSVMSLGAWLLFIFSLFSFIHLYLWLPEGYDIPHLVKKIPESWRRNPLFRAIENNRFLRDFRVKDLTVKRGLIAGFGIPISIGVGIYTGVLLGALVAKPFWNNPMLPMLFLLSALNTGAAAICLAGCFLGGRSGMSREEIETNKFIVHSIDFTLMVFLVIAVGLFLFGLYTSPRSSVEAAGLIMGGEFTFLFWVVFVGIGIILPLSLEVYELIPHFIKHVALREHKPLISGILAISVLLGGFTLRYVVVYAGQLAKVIA
jgi:formate-dependent nitrite reductase membrane component NrfD